MVADGGEMTTLPDSAGSSPARVRSSVDLPAPLTPTRPTTSPGATTRSRSENRTRAPCPAARPRATRVALTQSPRWRSSTRARQAADSLLRSQARAHEKGAPRVIEADDVGHRVTARRHCTGRLRRSPLDVVVVLVLLQDLVGHLV